MSSNDPLSSSTIPTTHPGVSVPSSLPTSSVPLPITSQDLVLQLHDDSMRRIVVGVGEYLRNVDTSQPTNQKQSWTRGLPCRLSLKLLPAVVQMRSLVVMIGLFSALVATLF